MAEDKADEILEEETAKDTKKKDKGETEASEDEAPKKGLSTSLLIKVAIGLGIVLIAMLAAFFLLPSSPSSDTTTTEETQISEAETTETADAHEDEIEAPSSVVTPESGSIELPSVAENTSAPSAAESASAATENTNTPVTTPVVPSSQPAAAINTPSDKVLSEMVALQKQLNTMQQENQKLIKRVEQLAKENQTLKSDTPQKAKQNSAASPVDDSQFVDNGDDEVPLYYRQNRYANTPQPELKPQWGEFQQLK